MRVMIVGAAGPVGTVLELLRERDFPADQIVAFATENNLRQPRARGIARRPRPLNADADLTGFDIALFSAGAGTSREWAPRFVEHGATVVDNSSAFRRDPEVPLVVSEVNPHALAHHRGVIANPNCSTMQLMVALAPIHRAVGIERLVVATYQSVSGTGHAPRSRELDARAARLAARVEMPKRRACIASRSPST